jgi:hypothetical protein
MVKGTHSAKGAVTETALEMEMGTQLETGTGTQLVKVKGTETFLERQRMAMVMGLLRCAVEWELAVQQQAAALLR